MKDKEYDLRCPKCEGPVEELRDSHSYITLGSVSENGDFGYGEETTEYENVLSIRCVSSDCGWVLEDENSKPITDFERILEWAKKQEVNAE